MRHKNTKRLLIGSIFSIIISLVLAEITLKVIGLPKLSISGWKSKAKELNDLGYRGQNIQYNKEDYVVVLLGDSQVESGSSKFEQIPEKILERLLNDQYHLPVKVFSVGTSGYGQDQQLLALTEYFHKYRADIVILWETRSNDIWNNTFRNHWPKKTGAAKPTYWLKKDQLTGPTEKIGEEINYSKLNLLKLLKQAMNPPIHLEEKWNDFLPQPYKPLNNYSGKWNDTWQKLYDDKLLYLHGDDFLEEKSHLSIYFTPLSERMRYSRELTKKLLEEIKNKCSKHGSKFVSFEAIREVSAIPEEDAVYRLNNVYYRASKKQAEESINYINQNHLHLKIPVTVTPWETKIGSDHLNTMANYQVLKDLTTELANMLQR